MRKSLLVFFVGLATIAMGSPGITLNITKADVLCYGDSTGAVLVEAAGDTLYAYNWSNGSMFSFIRDVPAGTYTVTVTGAGLASATASVNITQPSSAVSVSASASPTTSCTSSDGSVTASGSGGTGTITYPWSDGQIDSTISGLHAGIYVVSATDANGCSASAFANVNSPASFTLTPGYVAPSCYGLSDGQASVIVSGDTLALFYSWSTGDFTDTIQYLSGGTYYVTVTDAKACSKSISVTVNDPAPLTVTITSTPSTCSNARGSASASVTGGSGHINYLWNTSDTTSQIYVLNSGIYLLTVTSGVCSVTSSVAVSNSNGPTVTMNAFNPSCFSSDDGAIAAVVTGGTPPYAYAWNPGGASTQSIDSLTADKYTVSVTDHNQCVGVNTVVLVQPTYLVANPDVYDVTCNGGQTGSVTLSVTGGFSPYTFLWADNTTEPYDINLGVGSYDFTVTDVHQCQTSSAADIVEPGALVLAFSYSGSSGSNGSDTALASGGYTPYSYTWSNFENGMVDTSLAPGTYSVTVVDAKGCSITGSDTIIPLVSGINAVNTESFDVYPNPAQNIVYLIPSQLTLSLTNIDLTDITGKLIYAVHRSPANRYEIDLSGIANGIYFIEISADNLSARKKIVVAR